MDASRGLIVVLQLLSGLLLWSRQQKRWSVEAIVTFFVNLPAVRSCKGRVSPARASSLPKRSHNTDQHRKNAEERRKLVNRTCRRKY